jgi:hypothetical protein
MSLSAAASPVQPDRQPRPAASALFADLVATHSVLLERIKELGEVAEHAQPSRLECTSARLRLSQASIDRRSALNKALRLLEERSDPASAAAAAKVRAADGELIAHSVAHLAKWTTEAVAADWRGYCEASRSMREHMAGTVTAEAELLKPLCR